MDVHLSIQAKLIVTKDAAKELKATMEEFNRACDSLSELTFQKNLHRKYDLHHAGYHLIRKETNPPAQPRLSQTPSIQAAFFRAIRRPDHGVGTGLLHGQLDDLPEGPRHWPIADVGQDAQTVV